MMRNMKSNFFSIVILVAVIAFAGFALNTNAQAQKSRAAVSGAPPLMQQPLYSDYKGARLGMTPQEVRAKLGNPVLKDEELDYFVFSDNVTAQVAYDAAHKAKAISIDYAGGVGAPDYRAVVGSDLDTRPDGSVYKVIRYESLGFWVSYNRTAGPVVTVTVTIQKILP
jgi:hypothetical protein